ncbi:MAG TPA: glycosyltransferase family 2 protein, partial [Rhodothermales bacterium]
MARVSVIVPIHPGGRGTFRRCLDGVAASARKPHELVVVGEDCPPDLLRLAQSYGARIVAHAPARGPAFARNRGAEAATGDVLLFIDADVVIAPDVIGKVADAFDSDAGLSALIGSYDDAPGEPDFLSQYRNLLHHYVHQVSSEIINSFWGGCGAVRRDVFLSMGGFDESYPKPSIEDIEFGYRLTAAGHRIRLIKSLQVKHLKQWTATSIVKTDLFARAIPWTELILRSGEMMNDLNLKTDNRISVAASFVLAGSLVASFLFPVALIPAVAAAVVLYRLNAPVYRFFREKRGVAFAAGVLPWHWFFYLYSGIGFGIGLMRHYLGLGRARRSLAP